VAFLLLAILVGGALGSTQIESTYIYRMDQSVQGTGFFSYHKDIATGELALSDDNHGSGSYNDDSKDTAENEAAFDSESQEYDLTDEQSINFQRTVDFAYSPISFDLGRSFKFAGFQSKGKQDLCLKNYAGSNIGLLSDPAGISMNARFDSLDVLSNGITGNMFFKYIVSDSDDVIKHERIGNISMNLDSAFTGRGHIGVLDLYTDSNHPGLIDENYVGTFSLSKRISQSFRDYHQLDWDEWLPCCSNGWSDMTPADRRNFPDADSVFNCTCNSIP